MPLPAPNKNASTRIDSGVVGLKLASLLRIDSWHLHLRLLTPEGDGARPSQEV
jgi:hypothetical protein